MMKIIKQLTRRRTAVASTS